MVEGGGEDHEEEADGEDLRVCMLVEGLEWRREGWKRSMISERDSTYEGEGDDGFEACGHLDVLVV